MEATTIVPERSMNPWIWIWISPRKVMRQILSTDTTSSILLLGALSGIYRALNEASERSLGDTFSFPGVLAFCIVLGSLGGIASIFTGGAYFRWIGGWFGGKANADEVRAALAWSSIPSIASLVLMIALIAGYGPGLFSQSSEIETNIFLSLMALAFTIFSYLMLGWRFVLLVKCLAEAHEVSSWKSLAILVVGTLIVGIPTLILTMT